MSHSETFHTIAVLIDGVQKIAVAATKQALKVPGQSIDTKATEALRGRLLRLKTKVALRDQNPDAPADKYVLNEDPQLFFALKSLFKNDERHSEALFKLTRHCLGGNSAELIELSHTKSHEADPKMAAIADLAAGQSTNRSIF